VKKTVEQRFWEKVGPHDDPNVCWLWLACAQQGRCGLRYGGFWDGERQVLAHRFSYKLLVGPIPAGMTIDHVRARGCISTLCVNPAHLEVVTQKVNILRGDSFSAVAAKQTHCAHGHPFNEENTYVWHDERHCRICGRAACHGQREAKKVAA